MLHLAVAINDKDRDIMPIAVSLFTLSKAYHTELIFSDGTSIICDHTGVRFDNRTYDRYHWVLVPIPWISEKGEQEIRDWCIKVVEEKPAYDWLGAIFGGLSSIFDNPRKWFCSELCCAALRPYTPPLQEEEDTNIFTRPWWTPELLWRTVSEYLSEYNPRYSEGWKFRYRGTGIKGSDDDSPSQDAEKTKSADSE